MAELKNAELVILRSANGRDGWEMVKPEDVPDWVKSPDNIAMLVRGLSCMKPDEGDKGSDWYCARPVEEALRIMKAQEKRARRSRARVVQVHRENAVLRNAVRH